MTGPRAPWLFLLVVAACSEAKTELATDPLKSAGMSSDAAARDSAADATSTALDASSTAAQCQGHVCACDDGKDNDADALTDGFDPECTGPFDDDESTFATGAPAGANRCRDCFWDNNAGSGDDDCRYPEECLQSQTAVGKGACASCTVSQACVDHCAARTPNGCDCFGCCEVTRRDGSTLLVALTDACALDRLDDEKACPRCVQNPGCANPCGRCELCPGRAAQDLPADCGTASNGPRPRYVCDEGQPVCSQTAPCPPGAYCQLGCCLYVVE